MTASASPPVLAGIPVKPFGVAKQRLESVLDAPSRARLGKAMALRTAQVCIRAGMAAVIVTGSDAVRAWAAAVGLDCIDEGAPSLDGAARALAGHGTRRGTAWLFVHADLPLITPADLTAANAALRSGRTVLSPARDGGTNALGGNGENFPFAYGPGSFHRHVRAASDPVVITRPGLALDIDTPRDLMLAAEQPAGAWLDEYLAR